MWPYADGVRRFFVIGFAASLLAVGCGFVTPIFYKLFMEEVILRGQFDKMPLVIGGYLGTFAVGAAFGYLKDYAGYVRMNTMVYQVKQRIWQKFFALPFADYETTAVGEWKMRMEDDVGQVESFAGRQTVDFLISLLTLAVSTALLFVIDWRLALFAVSVIPLTFWVSGILGRQEAMLNEIDRASEQRFTGWLHASVQGWREVKALGLQLRQERQFIHFLHKHALYNAKWINYWTARVLVIPPRSSAIFFRNSGSILSVAC